MRKIRVDELSTGDVLSDGRVIVDAPEPIGKGLVYLSWIKSTDGVTKEIPASMRARALVEIED